MQVCPACRQKQQPEDSPTERVELAYCADCKVVWLEFGTERPRLYVWLDTQVRHWEAALARRQA